MNAFIKNWQTTALGVSAGLIAWLPVFHSWLVQNQHAHIGITQIFGLLVALLGVAAHDATNTTPTTPPPAAPAAKP